MGDYRYIENYFDNIPEKDSEFTDKSGFLLSEREIEGWARGFGWNNKGGVTYR